MQLKQCYNLKNYIHGTWRRSLSYRKPSIDLLCKSINWFLYDGDFRHKGLNQTAEIKFNFESDWPNSKQAQGQTAFNELVIHLCLNSQGVFYRFWLFWGVPSEKISINFKKFYTKGSRVVGCLAYNFCEHFFIRIILSYLMFKIK